MKADLKIVRPFPVTQDAKDRGQTAKDFVAEFAAGVADGSISCEDVLIFYIGEDRKPHIWRKGMGISDQIAYAALCTQMALNEWRDEG